MSQLVVPTGFALASLRWSLSGDPDEMVCTLGLELTVDSTPPEDIAEDVATQWSTDFAAGDLGVGWTFVGATVRRGLTGGVGPTGEFTVNQAGSGFASTPSSNCAILVRKTTGEGGRANRGRMFLPAGYMGESDVSATGALGGVRAAAIQANLDSFSSGLTSGLLVNDLVVLHSTTSPASDPTPITAMTVQLLIATQRQRMRR